MKRLTALFCFLLLAFACSAALGEVRQPRMPAVLVEIGYHDNRADALWIETRHGPRRAADVWIAVMPRPLPGPTRALAPAELSLLI